MPWLDFNALARFQCSMPWQFQVLSPVASFPSCHGQVANTSSAICCAVILVSAVQDAAVAVCTR